MSQKYLGNVQGFDGLDTFEVMSNLELITLTSEELIAKCPVTGHTDIYKIEIAYTPQEVALETKSLKLYLETFRDIGIFAENLVVKILSDLSDVLNPKWLIVTLTQNIRGGIVTKVEAAYPSTSPVIEEELK